MKELFRIQEKKRRILACELHDELGQWLTAIRAENEVILNSTGKDSIISISAQAIKECIQQMHEVIRSKLHKLRPVLLDTLGLSEALFELKKQWCSHHPQTILEFRLECDLTNLSEPLGYQSRTQAMKKTISILLIDDHPVVRSGYRRLLESTLDMRVVAEAENGEIGYQLYLEHQPNVTILDLNMPGIGGLETIRRIKAQDPTARILVFSMLNNAAIAQRSLKAGAIGFISKQSGIGEMIQAVRQVNSGEISGQSGLNYSNNAE